MTVTYAPSISKTRVFGLIKLLFRWSGSIWKLVLGEFIIFIVLYYAIFLLNTFGLQGEHLRRFHGLIGLFRDYSQFVPMSLLLGFYISQVTTRWWGTWQCIPWIATPAVRISSYVVGSTERARLVRRTLVRYLCMQMVLALRGISPPVRKRFPTLRHLVEAGIMTKSEYKELNSTTHDYGNYYIPTLWYTSLLDEAKREGLIENDLYFKILIDLPLIYYIFIASAKKTFHVLKQNPYVETLQEAVQFRSSCAGLIGYDCINIPLIYTQVATLAVYFYFFVCLLSRQVLPEKDHHYSFSNYIPIFTIVEFVLFIGWLKVGEVLINPLGGDDDDFDINPIIDLNVGAGALMVDRLHGRHPPVEKTKFWDMEKIELPYTKGSQEYFTKPHLGSMFDFVVPQEDSQWARQDSSGYDQEISKDMESRVPQNDSQWARDDKWGYDQKISEETEYRVPQDDSQWTQDNKSGNDQKISEETEPEAKTETHTTTICLPGHN